MTSEPDDNPFSRNSVWPRMPQAPFRVGPLPKAAPAPRPAPEAEPPRTITPVFVRPALGDVAPPGVATGGSITPDQARPRPPPVRAPVAPPVAPQAARTPDPLPPAEAPPPAPVDIAPMVVQPLRRSAKPKAKGRRLGLPAAAAVAVGLASLAGLAFLFSRGERAALERSAASPAAAVASAPVAQPAPTQPSAAPIAPAVAPSAAPVRVAAAPAVTARAVRRSPPIRRLKVAPATEAAVAVPVLPFAPPSPPAVEPAPPAYKPPSAPDPNAPIVTRTPYS